MNNFIKVNRKILKWEWWSDINTFRLFIYMLLEAWWKEGSYKGKIIPRGSFPSSISELSSKTKLTDNEIRTAIKHLKSTGEITSKSYNKFTVFTVKNYGLYQSDNEQNQEQSTGEITSKSQAINKQITSKSQADNKQITSTNIDNINNIHTEKEDKNKRIKEYISPISPLKDKTKSQKSKRVFYEDENLNKAFIDYMQMRKMLKKPMTDRAVTIAMNKLKKLSTLYPSKEMNVDLAIAIIDQSVEHSWLTFYPLKNESPYHRPKNAKKFEERNYDYDLLEKKLIEARNKKMAEEMKEWKEGGKK